MPASPLPLLLPAVDPAPVEAAAAATGQALYDAMLALHVYREQARARGTELTAWQFEHLRQVEALLDAIVADKHQTQQLLAVHEANVAGLNTQLHAAIGRGEAPAWLADRTPTSAELLAEREQSPLYRLGWVRGHRQGVALTQRRYETLASYYAHYAVLVPPAGYQPSPLAAQVQGSPAYQTNLPRLDYPLAARQDLAAITAHQLPDPTRAGL